MLRRGETVTLQLVTEEVIQLAGREWLGFP